MITVVGGGATGVEVAGTLAELRNIALAAAFPEVNRARVHIRLVELGPQLIAPFDASLRDYAYRQLEKRGVDVQLRTAIREVTPGSVILSDGQSAAQRHHRVGGRRERPRRPPPTGACRRAGTGASSSGRICG